MQSSCQRLFLLIAVLLLSQCRSDAFQWVVEHKHENVEIFSEFQVDVASVLNQYDEVSEELEERLGVKSNGKPVQIVLFPHTPELSELPGPTNTSGEATEGDLLPQCGCQPDLCLPKPVSEPLIFATRSRTLCSTSICLLFRSGWMKGSPSTWKNPSPCEANRRERQAFNGKRGWGRRPR